MRSKVNFLLSAHSHKFLIVVGMSITCLKSFKSLSSVGALNEINILISTVDELVGT